MIWDNHSELTGEDCVDPSHGAPSRAVSGRRTSRATARAPACPGFTGAQAALRSRPSADDADRAAARPARGRAADRVRRRWLGPEADAPRPRRTHGRADALPRAAGWRVRAGARADRRP